MNIKDQITAIVKTRPECDGAIFCGAIPGSLSRTRASHLGVGPQPLYRCHSLVTVALDELLPRVQSVVKCKLATIGLPLYVKVEETIQVVVGRRVYS